MNREDLLIAAKNLIATHGLRAQAVASERIAEARAQGRTAELAQWEGIRVAIAELRRTAPEKPTRGGRTGGTIH